MMNSRAAGISYSADNDLAVPRADSGGSQFEPVFKGRAKVVNWLGIALWMAAMIYFWVWWLQPDHVFTPARYVVTTLVMLWITLVPAYFIFIFAGARVMARNAPLPGNARVAMVVTKAPGEPFEVVRKTLLGMLDQDGVEHDTWLADEDPSLETLRWCKSHGVNVSTRKGKGDYHRETWPRRTRCKEGNLAYFYDKYGYDRYDFVAQFDADHVPDRDYLKNAITPFADPAVGYVSAPSICDSNAARSWAARGRLFVEASMHGALQTGYNNGLAPLCIGSHYTVRTAALKAIGGLGPELAEDHSTSLMFNAGGWKGVHAVNAIAHGEGPETFADLIVQEFQWSRSLVTILLQYSPDLVPGLPGRLRFQFLFSQLWYPMFSVMMAFMYLLPVVALVTGVHFVDVTYIDFFIHILPLTVVMLLLANWWRSTGLFRPVDGKIVSWEGAAFLFLRWPWSLAGSLMAVRDWITGRFVDFRVTPKGTDKAGPLPFRVVAPYIVLSGVSAFAAWLVGDPGTAAGFYIFTLANAVIYAVLALLVLWKHAREKGLPVIPGSVSGLASALSVVVVAVGIGAASYEHGPRGLATFTYGIKVFSLTRTAYPVAGAGQGQPGLAIYRFQPQWYGFAGRRVEQNTSGR